MFTHPEGLLVDVAKNRFGAASWQEARACGLSDRQIHHRIAIGMFEEPAPGALVIGAAPKTWEQQVAVAVLASGEGAAASHLTAAALWGMLNTSGGRVDVVVPRWDRNHRSFIVHESLDLMAEDVTIHRGIAVTNPTRTVVDAGAIYRSAVPEMYHRGHRLGLIDAESLATFVRRVARKGRRGVGPAKSLLSSLGPYKDVTESWAEDIYLKISRRAGMPEPTQQFEIRTDDGWFICRCDFAYVAARLAVFVDGFAYHGTQKAFQLDRAQSNQLSLIGWRHLRFTYQDLVNRPGYVLQQVASLLA